MRLLELRLFTRCPHLRRRYKSMRLEQRSETGNLHGHVIRAMKYLDSSRTRFGSGNLRPASMNSLPSTILLILLSRADIDSRFQLEPLKAWL